MAIELYHSIAVYPGMWLRAEIVDRAGLGVTAFAERLRVMRQVASDLLNGNARLSAEMATRFEKTFGVKADTLMRLQTAYELAEAPAREGEIRVKAALSKAIRYFTAGIAEGALAPKDGLLPFFRR